MRSGRLTRVRRGYFIAGPADVDDAARAVVASCAGTVISHRSAARLYGLPLIGQPPSIPELTIAPRAPGSLVAAHLYRASLDTADVVQIGDLPVTSVARTVIDLARHLSQNAAVAAADFALHEQLVTAEELDAVARRSANWPGIARARRSLARADARAESPLESISRLVLDRSELPRAVLQQRIGTQDGNFVARVDFGWAALGVVGEADGLLKYDDRDVLREEKLRQERLEQLGLIVVRWGWRDITREPETVTGRISAALDRRSRSSLPTLWSVLPDWTGNNVGKPAN
ncbi:MAG: hypothetical protein JWQ77_1608 [Jatrophihabitans sp.]|nr:hypothetical protein [Jatrophihabitans sp.]